MRVVMYTITLAAVGEGLGSFSLGVIDRNKIDEYLKLSKNLHTLYLITLGYPAQKSSMVDMRDNQFKYYLDKDELRVPKHTLNEIIIIDF